MLIQVLTELGAFGAVLIAALLIQASWLGVIALAAFLFDIVIEGEK